MRLFKPSKEFLIDTRLALSSPSFVFNIENQTYDVLCVEKIAIYENVSANIDSGYRISFPEANFFNTDAFNAASPPPEVKTNYLNFWLLNQFKSGSDALNSYLREVHLEKNIYIRNPKTIEILSIVPIGPPPNVALNLSISGYWIKINIDNSEYLDRLL
jgi:hypothetical protein